MDTHTVGLERVRELLLDVQVFVNLPNFLRWKKVVILRNTDSMPVVKIFFRLEFEQIS